MTMPSATTTPPSQGADAQPPAGGQGEPTAQGGGKGEFNWGLFPNVPEEQRSLLEPHLRDTLGHVTKLEQQYAPYKPLLEQGYTQENVQALLNFAQEYDQNPLGLWYRMAQQLEQQGVLPEDLDVEDLGRILQGLPPMNEEGGEGGEGGADPRDAQIQQLTQMVQQLQQRLDQGDQLQMQRQQDGLLQNRLATMKAQLKEAGVPEDAVTDEFLVGSIIAHKGDVAAATQALTGYREASLKGFTQQATEQSADLNMPKGAPPAGEKKRPPKDGFEAARGGALNHLRAAQARSAQE